MVLLSELHVSLKLSSTGLFSQKLMLLPKKTVIDMEEACNFRRD
jgi:hypothetical protein